MAWQCEPVQYPRLRPAANSEEYLLHQAALEWSLADPIIINSADDIKSARSWRELLKPYEHQVRNLMTFCRRLPVTLIADDVGLGKTISAGLILSELMERRKVSRALVLCPKILLPQWEEELLAKFKLESRAVTGRAFADELGRSTPVVVTTYDTARNYFDELERARFGFLILDEAHKLRNLYGTAKPPNFATRIHDALKKRTFKYVLMLTATPLHNRLWDLYSLVDCLATARGHENPLGDPQAFGVHFLADQSTGARRLRPQRAAQFHEILGQYLARTRRADVKLLFPQRKVVLIPVKPAAIELAMTGLVREVVQGLNGLSQASLAQALMSSPEALLSQLQTMSGNKTVPADALARAHRLFKEEGASTGKLEALVALVEQLREQRPKDWRVVVFTSRKETQRAIGTFLTARGISVGYISDQGAVGNQRAIEKLRSDPPGINVLVSTDMGAQGVNLQAANVLVNFDLPWNPMIVEQRIGRIQRLSSKHESVMVCNLVVKGSIEEKIVARLMAKLQMIAHAVGDIEAILEAANCDGEDDEASTFESQIREMVLKSLRGQDATAAATAMEENISRAQQMIEQQQEEMDRTLGSLDHLHNSGAVMPVLRRVNPSIKLQEFVNRSLVADGCQLEREFDGTIEVRRRGSSPDRMTFDADVARQATIAGQFGGRPVLLYQPGQPPFERLTQTWCLRSGHRVADLRTKSPEEWRRLGERWLGACQGAKLLDVRLESTADQFNGQVMCRVKAVVSHDSYEKLTSHEIADETHGQLDSEVVAKSDPLRTELVITDLCPGISKSVVRAVESDSDVIAFCNFYENRRVEELSLAGDDSRKRTKIDQDFTPKVFSDVVAAAGAVYSDGHLIVSYSIDGLGEYESSLRGIPATALILECPANATCSITGRQVPVDCLESCAITSQRALKHLLVVSQASGRRGLPEHGVRCESSGKMALLDEVESSEASGKVVLSSLLVRSPISGRRAMPNELQKCSFTGALVFPNELALSDISGRPYRIDQATSSGDGNAKGHSSEFGRCEHTAQIVPASDLEASSVSGRKVRRDLLVASERNPEVRGLPEEMEVCAASGKRRARTEVGSSGVSGRRVNIDLLVPSGKSGTRALREELKTCQRTGALLLPTEAETCVATGIVADRELLVQSEVSGNWVVPEQAGQCALTGKKGMRSELVACEVSGQSFLPAALERCTVTSKLVDRRLLIRSQASDQLALPEAMTACAKTGKRVLPSELATCEETGQRVLPSELDRCALSGEMVLRDRLVKSKVSGVAVKRAKAVLSIRGGFCLPSEAQTCTWLNGPVLPSQAATCKLTGLLFASDLLNAKGEFAVLSDMLDGTVAGDDLSSVLASLAKNDPKRFSGARTPVGQASPSRHLFAVCFETKAMLGLMTRFHGLLVRNANPPQVTGRVVEGKRSAGTWTSTT